MTVDSIKIVCEEIWKIESRYDLFNQKISGVYFWKLVRVKLFNIIVRKAGLYGQAHTPASQNPLNMILYIPTYIKNTLLHGAIRRNTKKDILIIEHPRKILFEGEYRDIYTDVLIKGLDGSYEIIARPHFRKHYNRPDENRSYNEHFALFDSIKKVLFKLKNEDKELLFLIKKDLYEALNIEIDLPGIVEQKIADFKYGYSYYDKLIKKRSPRKIYLVVSYGLEAMIAAGKDNNVKTIEMQHGTIDRYNLGYSFPDSHKVPYFPDELYLFGKYWFDSTTLPLDQEAITYYGFPYLEKNLRKYRDIEKKKDQILFISQGTIGKELSEIACKLAHSNSNLEVIYKLHPGEYARWRSEYKHLIQGQDLKNLRIIDNNRINLYQLLAESEYQVGVYSTAIYEGLSMKCKTVLVNLPGIEYMDYLIENDYVKLADDEAQVEKHITSGEFKDIDRDYFFKCLFEKSL